MTEFIITGLVTLLGAFFGAFAAFEFQNIHEKERQQTVNKMAIKLVLFHLMRALNILNHYYEDYLKDNEDIEQGFFSGFTKISDENLLSVDFESIAFVLESNDPDLLGRLSALQTGVNSLIIHINERTMIWFNQAQVKVEDAGLSEERQYSLEYLRDTVFGPRIYFLLERMFNHQVEHVPKLICKLNSAIDELNKLIKASYPDDRALNV